MAKDPAFLFYSSDFLTGTMFMSNEQVGLYVRMLCAQHQHGGLIDTNVLRTQCDSITGGNTVYNKFTHSEYGSYNSRLLVEMDKRKEKSLKAKESVNSRWEKERIKSKKTEYDSNTNVLRSVNENENENRDVIAIEIKQKEIKKFIVPTSEEIAIHLQSEYPDADQNGIVIFSKKFWSHYEQKGWMVGKSKMKNWKLALVQWGDTLQKDLFPQNIKSFSGFGSNQKTSPQQAGMIALQQLAEEMKNGTI